ncbi:MAG: hypothetical protein QM757_26430 [Paludibaculum sp.]
MVTQTNTLWAQSEKVRPKLEAWLPSFKSRIFSKIKDKNVEKVSERDYRIPFKTSTGGKEGTYDPNMGAFGRGSSATGGVLISTFFPFRINFELSELETVATEDKEKAVASKFKMAMADAMPTFAKALDKWWHRGDGTAVVGQALAHATVNGATQSQYTLDANFGVATVRVGMPVRIMNTAMNAYKTIGGAATETTVLQVDWDARTVTLSGVVDAAAATDKLVMAGSTGNSPQGMKGLPYYNNYATSGSTLGLDRALQNEIITPSVNANGGISNTHGIQLLGKKLKLRDGDFPTGLFGVSSVEVYQQIVEQVMTLQRIDVQGETAKMKDTAPSVRTEYQWCGVQHYVDVYQDMTRVDWVDPGPWGWSSMAPMSFYEVGGQRFFPLYGTDGSPAAGLWFAMRVMRDCWCADPRSGGVIYGIS